MTQVYELLDKIKEDLRNSGIVNTVSFGDIGDLDLAKTTIYPLSHLMIDNAIIRSHTIDFTLRIMCLDIVDYNKKISNFDTFYGNNNLQDVLNTQLQVINSVVQKLRRGDLYVEGLQVDSDITVTPFKEKIENELAGWGADINVSMANTISIC